MWKLIIIAMLTGTSPARHSGGAHIEIWESKFKTEAACRIAAYELGSIDGHMIGKNTGPYKVRAFCFKWK